jgi:hypothetical protein
VKSLVFLLSACITGCSYVPVKPPAPSFSCNSMCLIPCVDADKDTGLRWLVDPTDAAAWDALKTDILDPLVERLRVCEVRRNTCAQCLRDLKTEGVIQ